MAVLCVHGVIYLHGLISLESWQENLVWRRFLKWRVGNEGVQIMRKKKRENYNGGPTWVVELGCATWSLDPTVPLQLDFVVWQCLCHNNVVVMCFSYIVIVIYSLCLGCTFSCGKCSIKWKLNLLNFLHDHEFIFFIKHLVCNILTNWHWFILCIFFFLSWINVIYGALS